MKFPEFLSRLEFGDSTLYMTTQKIPDDDIGKLQGRKKTKKKKKQEIEFFLKKEEKERKQVKENKERGKECKKERNQEKRRRKSRNKKEICTKKVLLFLSHICFKVFQLLFMENH